MATTLRIDWRTGFYRLWIIISVLWIGVWGVVAGTLAYERATYFEHLTLTNVNAGQALGLDYTILSNEELIGLNSALKANVETPIARAALDKLAKAKQRERPIDVASWLSLLAMMFGPPIAIRILGKALAWAFSGFTRPSTP